MLDNPILSQLVQFLPLVGVFGVLYFLVLRPQQVRMKEHKKAVEALKRGDRVLVSGFEGSIDRIAEGQEDVQIEIAPGVVVKAKKSSITEILSR
jgi:preprotein translocase subunit YajC